MRVIEREMLEAIKHGRNWSKDNTRVNSYRPSEVGFNSYVVDVYLHDNHIAALCCTTGGEIKAFPNVSTLLHWPTRTTMSRLRALGVDVCTRKGDVYLNGERI